MEDPVTHASASLSCFFFSKIISYNISKVIFFSSYTSWYTATAFLLRWRCSKVCFWRIRLESRIQLFICIRPILKRVKTNFAIENIQNIDPKEITLCSWSISSISNFDILFYKNEPSKERTQFKKLYSSGQSNF